MIIRPDTFPIKAISHDFFSPMDLKGVDLVYGSNSRQPSIWFMKDRKLLREWLYKNHTERNEEFDRLMAEKLKN